MSDATRILVVEDDASLARVVLIHLRARGYEVTVATTAAQALDCARKWQPHALLLDLGLPDASGLTVLRSLRAWSGVPVLIISARHDHEGKINALDEGADDYVTKPFSIGELLARLRAALRRCPQTEAASPVVTTADGALSIDLSQSLVRYHGQPVHLTPHEWGVVAHLASHAGQLVRKADLLKAVWGDSYERETNYLRVYLSQVRQKLERDPSHPEHFLTEAGMGYRFVV
ncbi:response regulator [Corynebacterium lowii]|uniref:KDP operon transcriptional regulatory protein KdpE n=1 Tax=Corynebacterium lowii TaxID=1544413 RepID=A0A0Q1AHY5_9CORY|nr:response regulator transcription factor [Corynebacterium lowii]KQB86237.1 KDP operon transcriptional regulatory protein KdpE [Corynebacterium lowii]MDP9852711.1 two-component system KDP operon response regulator KdpE [Corynebacterium lowii]